MSTSTHHQKHPQRVARLPFFEEDPEAEEEDLIVPGLFDSESEDHCSGHPYLSKTQQVEEIHFTQGSKDKKKERKKKKKQKHKPTPLRRDSVHTTSGLKNALLASIPRDEHTPPLQQVDDLSPFSMLHSCYTRTPGCFGGIATTATTTTPTPNPVTPLTFHRNPSQDSLYSLFNSPVDEVYPIGGLDNAPAILHPQEGHARRENGCLCGAPKLVSEDSARKAAEVLRQKMAPFLEKKKQESMAESLRLERVRAIKTGKVKMNGIGKVKAKKRRLQNGQIVFAAEMSPEPVLEDIAHDLSLEGGSSTPSPRKEPHTTRTTATTTPQKHLTPHKKRKALASTTTSTGEEEQDDTEDSNSTPKTTSASTPSPSKTDSPLRSAQTLRAEPKPKPTKHQVMLKKAREMEAIKVRDTARICQGLREGKGRFSL